MTDSKHPTKSLHINAADFQLTLTELGIDRNLTPAVKVAVNCTIPHSGGTFSYQADDIWLDFESLENFISELGHMSHKSPSYASLTCLGRTLKLEVTRQQTGCKIRLLFTEYHPDQEDITLSASFAVDDLSLLQTWYRGFSEFRR